MTNQPKPKTKRDPQLGIKYIAWKRSQLPSSYNMAELVRYARFFLAIRTKRLYKDPIWDSYTVEELLVEFYAHQFQENKQFRQEFEASVGNMDPTSVDSFSDWADKEMSKEAKIRETTLGQMEENVSFRPDMVMGEDE